MPRSLASLPALLAACLVASVSAADPRSPEDVRRADALFQEAQRLLDAKKIHEACDKFAESQRLDPALGTLLNLADCHAQDGRTATARAEYKEALALAAARHDKREGFARGELAELEKRLSVVLLAFAAGARVDELRVDGVPLERSAWGEPLALDPGDHEIALAASGKKARVLRVSVQAGPSTQEIAIAALDDERAPVARAEAPAPAPIATMPPAESASRRTLGYVGIGLGVVAIGWGTYFG